MNLSPQNFDLIVIGAGPAGLTGATEAQQLSKNVLVLEAESQVGGISKTVARDGYLFDLGGHRFFTKVPRVEEFWNEVLPETDFLVRPRKSRIFYKNKFFDYPLKPLNAFISLGPIETVRCIISYILVRIFPPRNQDNFEGWVAARFGWRLYRIFFKTYTEKVWGIPTNQIQADWAAQRIKNLSLLKAIINAFGYGKNSGEITTLINSFRYPRKGPGMLWEACAQKFVANGGVLNLDELALKVTKDTEGYLVTSNLGVYRAKAILSTLPISQLPKILDCADSSVISAAGRLKHRDFLIVALVVATEVDFDDNWIYIHSEGVKVGRIQNFGSWSPEMVLPGTACLGLEYFVNEGDETWAMEDSTLITFAKQEIEKLALVEISKITAGYVVRVPKAYPVYDSEYEKNLELIAKWTQKNHPNVIPVGRNGMHRYNNQDHSMLTAMLAIENLYKNSQHNLWAVNVEDEYHEESKQSTGRDAPIYPTLGN